MIDSLWKDGEQSLEELQYHRLLKQIRSKESVLRDKQNEDERIIRDICSRHMRDSVLELHMSEIEKEWQEKHKSDFDEIQHLKDELELVKIKLGR